MIRIPEQEVTLLQNLPQHLFEQPPEWKSKQPAERKEGENQSEVEDKSEEKSPDGDEYLLCANCRKIITAHDHGTVINNSHKHTFANPHGNVYEIGCFISADCACFGRPSIEFTWFTGYAWRIATCGRCRTHLGWQFISTADSIFYGLILDCLVPGKED